MILQRLSAGLLFTLLFAACSDRTPPAPESQLERRAKIFTVVDATIRLQRNFVGRVEAVQTIDVSFEVSGPLRELPVLEGQDLAAGDLIAALDPTDFELAVREAEVQVKLSKQDLERKREVLKQRSIARSVVDDAQARYELDLVRLGQARERLAKTRISAPFAATVAQRYVDNFVNVQAGANVVRLHDLTRLLVVANIPESLAATANEDQLLSLYAQFGFSGERKFPLALYENRGEADDVAQTYEVSFVMERPDDLNVLPGMTATVQAELLDPAAKASLYVPVSALQSDAEGSVFVWRYHAEDGTVSRQLVEVGSPDAKGVPIVAGLSDGDQIVEVGGEHVQDGMKISPLEKTM